MRILIATDARHPQVTGVVHGPVAGPFFAQDGKAIESIVPVNLGSKGWNGASTATTASPSRTKGANPGRF